MKKILILFAMLLLIDRMALAQTTATSPAVLVNGSYVTTTSVDVYPFNGVFGTAVKQPYIDKSLHFKMRKNKKFFIVKVVDSASTTMGYIITPWMFKGTLKKDTFYKKVLNSKAAYYKKLAAIKIAIDSAKSHVKKDSLSLDTAKTDLAKSQIVLQKATDAFIKTSPTIKPAAGKKNAPVKPEVTAFIGIQNKLKAELTKSNNLSDSTKKISSILKDAKATTPEAEKAISAAQTVAVNTDVLSTNLKTAQNDLNDSKAELFQQVVKADLISAEYKIGLFHDPQSDKETDDSVLYRKTKPEIYDHRDTGVTDTASLAAKYEDLAYIDSWANHWQFFITAKDFADNAITIYPHSNKFTWGFLTLPIKMRLDNSNPGGRFKFEQNLNFGLTFGDRIQWKNTDDFSTNFLVGISVVDVPLNATDATGTTPAVAATSTPAISMSIGTMFQYNKFQFGVFVGRDYAGEHANQFAYQHKLWMGFAIGLSLFGESKTTATAQQQ